MPFKISNAGHWFIVECLLMIHSRKGRWPARVTNTGLCVSCEQAGLDLHYEIRELDVIWILGLNMEEYGWWWWLGVATKPKKIGPMRTPRYHDENRPIGIPNFKTCSRRAHKDTRYQTPSHKKHPLSSLITWYSDYQCNHRKQSYPVSTSPMIQHIEAETKWPPFRRRPFETHFREWNSWNCD